MNENTKTNKEKVNWKALEFGALWTKGNAGETRYSGEIKLKNKTVNIAVFPNRFKKAGSNEPDFRIHFTPESYQEIFGKPVPPYVPKVTAETKVESKQVPAEEFI